MSSSQPRHQARAIALQILYRYDASGSLETWSAPGVSPLALAEDIRSHFEHFHVTPELREFAATLVAGAIRQRSDIDSRIEATAAHWKVSRMGHIDRSILRLSVWELTQTPATPASVVINEAIELAKEFGTEDSAAFVNGILDAIHKKTST